VHTAQFWVTDVVGAGIRIITGERVGGGAATIDTLVAGGACISIIAGAHIGRVSTAFRDVAEVVCAWIVVVAFNDSGAFTDSITADIARGACIAVVTDRSVFYEGAARSRITGVVGTGIGVAAIERIGARLA
jgi:hypothetical protein